MKITIEKNIPIPPINQRNKSLNTSVTTEFRKALRVMGVSESFLIRKSAASLHSSLHNEHKLHGKYYLTRNEGGNLYRVWRMG